MKSIRKLISLLLVLAIVGTVVVVKPGEKVRAASSAVERILNRARSHLGENEYDGSFHGIVDTYKDYTGRSDLNYGHSWCAMFVSTLFIETNMTSIMNISSGCTDMMAMFNSQGRYHSRGYVPQPGDLIFYDWECTDSGDADHVGIVESCDGYTITVIEGNLADGYKAPNGVRYDCVGYRDSRNGKQSVNIYSDVIAGYGTPDYDNAPNNYGNLWYPADDFYAWIVKKDGWVHLESASNGGKDHNVALAPGGNNGNYAGQLWRFEKQSNGTYVIYNQYDGYVLDAYGAGTTKGTNVYTYAEYVGGANQQWYLYNTGNGIVIKAAHCDLVLDVTGGSSALGTNVELWDYNGSGAQLFSVYIIAKKCTDPSYHAYIIDKVPWKHIEATDGSNVQIAANGNDSHDPKQIWYVNKQSDSSYKIVNAYDSKVLDCYDSSNTRGTNVQTYKSGDTSNQRFYLYRVESEYGDRAGGFIIRPKYSNHLVLDVTGGTADKGTNIELWNFNFTSAQVFSVYNLKTDGLTYQKPGKPVAPTLTAPTAYTVGEQKTVSWTKSAMTSDKFDAREYRFEALDSSGKVIYSGSVGDSTSTNIQFTDVGTFKIRIIAVNTKYRDYYSTSNVVTCIVGSKNITNLTFETISDQVYRSREVTPDVTIKDGDTVLEKDKDYSITYSNNINVGTATAKIVFKGNYSGTKTLSFRIVPKSMTGTGIYPITDQTYTGFAVVPSVTVIYKGKTLVKETDYTVSFSNNTNVGTATATFTGKGNYTGTKTVTFKIVAKSVSGATVTAIADQTYTGSAIQPAVTVKDGSKTLVKGTDYTVSYTNNINVGTATVTITGKGNYTGTKSSTFKIVQAPVPTIAINAIANQTYTGSAIIPAVTVKSNGTVLTKDTHYTVTYSNNTNVGTATVKVTGKGTYAGASATATFKIVAKSVSGATVSAIADQTYTGSAIHPAVTVKDGSKTLVKGTDYTVVYKNNTAVGTATVTITGKGNYTGSETLSFSIVAKANFTVNAISDQTYTGSALTPGVTVKDGSKTLIKDSDYTVAYKDNINAGTVTVTVTGKGNYSGITKTTTFKINPKSIEGLTFASIPSQTYTGSALTPDVTVKDGSKTLVKGTDYTVVYKNNTAVGTATVTITGKGNFNGKKAVSFEIVEESKPKFSWKKISGKWYYIDQKGNKAIGFTQIGGKTYYFNKSGVMLTGWQKINGSYYFFASSGSMLTGWQKISKKWYYLSKEGKRLTGLQKISGKIYYFDGNGVMKTGWQKIKGNWYYFLSGGNAAIGWKKINKKKYYFFEDGIMASITVKDATSYVYKSSSNYFGKKHCFHIPKITISGVDTSAVNKKILNDLNPIIKAEKSSHDTYLGMHYKYYYNGNVITIVVEYHDCMGYPLFKVYNINGKTGKMMSDSELLTKCNVSENDFYKTVKSTYAKLIDDYYWKGYPEDEEFRQETLASNNVHKAQPYLNEKNELCFVGSIEWLDAQGNYLFHYKTKGLIAGRNLDKFWITCSVKH